MERDIRRNARESNTAPGSHYGASGAARGRKRKRPAA
eukprot:gene7255-22959_t